MTKMVSALTLTLVTLVPAAAAANTIDYRQTIQAGKIEQGRENGSITWSEGLKLRAEQRKIARTKAFLKSDGHLSKSDKRKLTQMQNKAAKHIAAESHDRLRRVWWLPRVGR